MHAAWIAGVQLASARLSLVGCEWRSLAAGCSSLRVHVDLGREGYAPPVSVGVRVVVRRQTGRRVAVAQPCRGALVVSRRLRVTFVGCGLQLIAGAR